MGTENSGRLNTKAQHRIRKAKGKAMEDTSRGKAEISVASGQQVTIVGE